MGKLYPKIGQKWQGLNPSGKSLHQRRTEVVVKTPALLPSSGRILMCILHVSRRRPPTHIHSGSKPQLPTTVLRHEPMLSRLSSLSRLPSLLSPHFLRLAPLNCPGHCLSLCSEEPHVPRTFPGRFSFLISWPETSSTTCWSFSPLPSPATRAGAQ